MCRLLHLPILCVLLLSGCSAINQFGKQNEIIFNEERGSLPRKNIIPGISVYGETTIDYKKSHKSYLKAKFKQPVIIDVADRPYGWGFFQFPLMGRMDDGSIIVQWHLAEDNIKDYGKGAYGSARSTDDGKTWQILENFKKPYGGIIAPNSDRIAVYTPRPIKVEDLNLPKPAGFLPDYYNPKEKLWLYKTKELPEAVNGIWINRAKKGDVKWNLEKAKLIDENSLRYSLRGLFPVVWWGEMQTWKDGNIYTCTYPGNRLGNDGMPVPKPGIDCYKSNDNGKTWQFQGYINYIDDKTMDLRWDKRSGFSEPAFEILKDGTFVSVLRTTDGSGHGPMYICHSYDKGLSWTNPKAITPSGVLPKLLQLKNGVLVLSTGRPGVQLLFSKDNGKTWTEAFELLNVPVTDEWNYTCGYTEIIPTGNDSFLIVYSDFKHKNDKGEERKAIVTREVFVK